MNQLRTFTRYLMTSVSYYLGIIEKIANCAAKVSQLLNKLKNKLRKYQYRLCNK